MSWRQVDVLSQLKITCKQLAHLQGVVCETGEVKVGEWSTGKPGRGLELLDENKCKLELLKCTYIYPASI